MATIERHYRHASYAEMPIILPLRQVAMLMARLLAGMA